MPPRTRGEPEKPAEADDGHDANHDNDDREKAGSSSARRAPFKMTLQQARAVFGFFDPPPAPPPAPAEAADGAAPRELTPSQIFVERAKRTCECCTRLGAAFTCPRCRSPFCGRVSCYHNHNGGECQREFEREQREEALRARRADDETRRETEAMLARFGLQDDREGEFGGLGGLGGLGGDDDDDDGLGQLYEAARRGLGGGGGLGDSDDDPFFDGPPSSLLDSPDGAAAGPSPLGRGRPPPPDDEGEGGSDGSEEDEDEEEGEEAEGGEEGAWPPLTERYQDGLDAAASALANRGVLGQTAVQISALTEGLVTERSCLVLMRALFQALLATAPAAARAAALAPGGGGGGGAEAPPARLPRADVKAALRAAFKAFLDQAGKDGYPEQHARLVWEAHGGSDRAWHKAAGGSGEEEEEDEGGSGSGSGSGGEEEESGSGSSDSEGESSSSDGEEESGSAGEAGGLAWWEAPSRSAPRAGAPPLPAPRLAPLSRADVGAELAQIAIPLGVLQILATYAYAARFLAPAGGPVRGRWWAPAGLAGAGAGAGEGPLRAEQARNLVSAAVMLVRLSPVLSADHREPWPLSLGACFMPLYSRLERGGGGLVGGGARGGLVGGGGAGGGVPGGAMRTLEAFRDALIICERGRQEGVLRALEDARALIATAARVAPELSRVVVGGGGGGGGVDPGQVMGVLLGAAERPVLTALSWAAGPPVPPPQDLGTDDWWKALEELAGGIAEAIAQQIVGSGVIRVVGRPPGGARARP